MNRNHFDLLYAIKKNGLDRYHFKFNTNVLNNKISNTLIALKRSGLIDENGITEKGINSLLPYKVDNAVIMAAGLSSRFVPISLEKPKGLIVVKNEVLIERQIEQLQQAGIKNIVLVLGYKKEDFYYLADKYDGIKIVINSEFNLKNNTHTLYVAQQFIRNSFVCSSDDYFETNPFEEYVYNSYYAAIHVSKKTNEWYMIPDEKGNIAKVEKTGEEGFIMLGHAYWDKQFSKAMIRILNDDYDEGHYDQVLWEQVLAENIAFLPPMEIKNYPNDMIFEFDSLDELRLFDLTYVDNSRSIIMKNIACFFECSESEISNIKNINEGLTNHSFVFEINGKKYVYRHPGEGTETIISRKHEKKALELAKSINVDPTYLYMDENEGWKISTYIEDIRIPSYDSFQDSRRVLNVMRHLHNQGLSVDWVILPWEEACRVEKILKEEKEGISDPDFENLKILIEKCYQKCEGDGVAMCFCHCDTYAPNWMLTENDTILIDGEYAGLADPGCDIGTYIMDSMWEVEEAKEFIKEYCQENYNETLLFHYLAYTAVVSFRWYVWALYREACGATIGQSLKNWKEMAKRFSQYLIVTYQF